jgi:dihydroorotate dehydrogenase
MLLRYIEKKLFERGLMNCDFFRSIVRRGAYLLAGGDPERVHEMALEALNEYSDVVKEVADNFDSSALHVNFGDRRAIPFGTAAGLDKNCDALEPLSHLFGFQEVGTIVVDRREGNPRPRVAVDAKNGDLYNAQGFPSNGLGYAENRLREYRSSGGKGFILANICGIPPDADSLNLAFVETEILLEHLNPYVDGFVWNPFSPNTAALSALRTPESFEHYGRRIKERAGKRRLSLVKMGPYDDNPESRTRWLSLVESWMKGGGDGIVAVNTYMVPKENVPLKKWGYPSAGRSGRFLQEYRQHAISDARLAFPNAVIIGTGGIDSAEQAWNAFEAGADALEGYTPYTFHGFGLLFEMLSDIREKLRSNGYDTFAGYRDKSRR